jgi:hypothetical protein
MLAVIWSSRCHKGPKTQRFTTVLCSFVPRLCAKKLLQTCYDFCLGD